MRSCPKSLHGGFTLVEMAMVLMIVALLLGGLVPTISAQMEAQRISETRRQMSEIRDVLLGFAVINGRLPCPAQATIATGSSNAGIEATTGNSCSCQTASGSTKTIANSTSGIVCSDTSVTGVLPWATLGLPEKDAWNRRFTYRVTTRFADQIVSGTTDCTPAVIAPTASSFALCSPGVLDIMASSGGTKVAKDVPAVFVSHGTNGAGAFDTNGNQLTVSGNSDEAENSDNDTQFVSHEFTTGYDDLLGWISPAILFSKMVSAGKLP